MCWTKSFGALVCASVKATTCLFRNGLVFDDTEVKLRAVFELIPA